MLKFTKRFAGSYKAELVNGEYFNIVSMAQFTAEVDQDDEGNKWVLTYSDDFNGDYTHKAKTKADLVKVAEYLLTTIQSTQARL